MTEVALPWGDEEIKFELPSNWTVEAVHAPPGVEAAADPVDTTAEAVSKPIASPPLGELAQSAGKIVIAVDDSSRPTPAFKMLPAIMKILEDAGKTPDDITFVFAVATHRPMKDDEVAAKIGKDIADKYKWIMHDAHADDLVKKGVTKRGTEVFFNSIVDAADLRILVGAIDGHPQAGFGGGYKMLLPGCAGARSVADNHMIMPSAEQYNLTAMDPAENPMRQDLEEACLMLSGKNFLVNTVLTTKGEIGEVVAGDPIEAHREAIKILLRAKGVRVDKPYDVVITSSSPMDLDLRQGGKAITSAAFACRPDGLILAALRAYEGMGKDAPSPKLKVPNMKIVRGFLKILGAKRIYNFSSKRLKKVPPEEKFMVNITVQLAREFKLIVYAPTVFKQSEGKLGNIFFEDREKMMKRASKWIGKGPKRVGVFPKGAGMIVLKDSGA